MNYNYTMPIGIPAATLNFTKPVPDRPAEWEGENQAEVAGYYYVSDSGDKKREYGTPDNPRLKIPQNLSSSAYIEVEGDFTNGLYTNNSLIVDWTGDDSEEFVAGVSGQVWLLSTREVGKTCTMKNFKLILKGSHVFVTNLTFDTNSSINVGSVTFGNAASNMVIRYNRVLNPASSAIPLNGSSEESKTDNIVIYSNEMSNFGTIDRNLETDKRPTPIAKFVSNVWIINNYMHTGAGGLQVHAGIGKTPSTYNIFVGGNTMHTILQSALWVKEGKNVIFSSNHIYNIIPTYSSPGKGMGSQYAPDGLWFINNHIHGVEYGIVASSSSTLTAEWGSKFYIIGNVIYDVSATQSQDVIDEIRLDGSAWQRSAINIQGGQEVYIYNNLMFNSTNGICIPSSTPKVDIKNNVSFDMNVQHDKGTYGYHIWSEESGISGGKVKIDNNYFDNKGHIATKEYGTRVFHETNEELTAAGGNNNIYGQQFISNSDLELIMKEGSISDFDLSVLENIGASTAAITRVEYAEKFGSDVLNGDILGMVREQGAGIDIGAFEAGGAYVPALPKPALDLYVDMNTDELVWKNGTQNVDTISVLKNGVPLQTGLPKTSTRAAISGMTSNIDEYSLESTNGEGTVTSETIKSSLVSSEFIVGAHTEVVPDSGSALITRTQWTREGTVDITEIASTQPLEGLPYSKTKFLEGSNDIGEGYVYSVANEENTTLTGSVKGGGVVDFLIMSNNYADSETIAEFIINDSKLVVVNTGDFQQWRVTLTFTEDTDWAFKAVTKESKSAIGVSAIVEK